MCDSPTGKNDENKKIDSATIQSTSEKDSTQLNQHPIFSMDMLFLEPRTLTLSLSNGSDVIGNVLWDVKNDNFWNPSGNGRIRLHNPFRVCFQMFQGNGSLASTAYCMPVVSGTRTEYIDVSANKIVTVAIPSDEFLAYYVAACRQVAEQEQEQIGPVILKSKDASMDSEEDYIEDDEAYDELMFGDYDDEDDEDDYLEMLGDKSLLDEDLTTPTIYKPKQKPNRGRSWSGPVDKFFFD